MEPIQHRPSYRLSFLSIVVVATFAGVVALVTMIMTGSGRDRALEQRWYGLLASGNPAILGTFRTENLVVDLTSNLGAVGDGSNVGVGVTNIDGPTRQTITIPGGDYDFGELNLSTIDGTIPNFPHDLFVSVIRNTGSADTTLHTSHSGGIAVEVTGTRTGGANDMTNTALECESSGAQINECIHVLAGDFVFDGGGAITQNSGTAFFGGSFLAATGPVIAENNGLRAIYISADPGPTDSIYSLAADSRWNVHHVTLSTLSLYNDSGPFELKIAGPALADYISPNGVPALDHGTISTKATDWVGHVTAVGANTSVTMTYTQTYPNGSECQVAPLSTSVAIEQIIPNPGTHTVTFSCFGIVAGTAANCDDFSYNCVGY